jgi:hypothetical protein
MMAAAGLTFGLAATGITTAIIAAAGIVAAGGMASVATRTTGFPASGHLLGQPAAALVLAGYAAAALLIGAVMLRRRASNKSRLGFAVNLVDVGVGPNLEPGSSGCGGRDGRHYLSLRGWVNGHGYGQRGRPYSGHEPQLARPAVSHAARALRASRYG